MQALRNLNWLRIITESVAIVASILLAFAIDASWEKRQEDEIRANLIVTIVRDFTVTRENLAISIGYGESLINKNERLLRLAKTGEHIDIDEFRVLARSFFRAISFDASLASFDAAVGPYGLTSISSPEFLRAVAEFRKAQKAFEKQTQVDRDIFFGGSILELRRELGSLRVLLNEPDELVSGRHSAYPQEFQRGIDELIALIKRPDIYGVLESIYTSNKEKVWSLKNMDAASQKVLTSLHHVQ